MDAGERSPASPGQNERSPWPLDLNLPLGPSATKDTPLLPPSPSPIPGGGYRALSPTPSLLQPTLLMTPSSLHLPFLPKLPVSAEPNCQEEEEDEGEALPGRVLFSSDGSVYLLKGEEEGTLPRPASPSAAARSPPRFTSFRLTATYQGFRSNQISRHTSAGAADLAHPAPGASPGHQDQSKEKEPRDQGEEADEKANPSGGNQEAQWEDVVWMCHPCQLSFGRGDRLGRHASQAHGLDHPYQDQLAAGETSAIVHGSNRQLFFSLLEPNTSHGGYCRKVLEAGLEPEMVAQSSPLIEVSPSVSEQRAHTGNAKDLTSNPEHPADESQVAPTGVPGPSPQLPPGLVLDSLARQNRRDSTVTPHPTEAKDSKADMDGKNGEATWHPAVTKAMGEGGVEEDEEDEEREGTPPTSDITEQLLANQSFYGPMMTSSFLHVGGHHCVDKRGDQTDTDCGPRALDDYTMTSGPQPFQSLSLQGHLSLLHSRNSCKTLKCPKCNWHYKYQQTLDVHMKEKHPESHSHCSYCHTGQQHPRLARGESYNCGYKPYRCEACNYSTTTKGNLTIHMQSDKHLANLQGHPGPSTTPNTVAPPLTALGVNAGQGEAGMPSPPDRQLKQKASWHCKVCNYETNISRNLRIHMTSEKHMQNVLLLHQGLGMGQDVFPFYSPDQGPDHPLLFNHMHFNSSGGPVCSLLAPDSHLGGPQLSSPAPSSVAMATPAPQPDPPSSPKPDESSPGVFRCMVCRCFTTDSLEGLLSHAGRGRTLPEREWREVRGDLHCCRLCSYSTQLKANFQLHLKTDKHAQKYQLAAHMREGGAPPAQAQASAAELPISGYSQAASFPPLHLRCNLCGVESNSREKIQLHVQGGGHGDSLRGYKFLQTLEGAGGGEACFHCAPCDSSMGSRLGAMSHLRSAGHHQNLAQWRLTQGEVGLDAIITICRSPPQERVKQPKAPETTSKIQAEEQSAKAPQAPVQDEAATAECENATDGTTVFCCLFCAYVSPSEDRVHSHAVSQHALQPTFRCPLCQEQLSGASSLRGHLGLVHNVVTECVEKLLQVAQKVEISFPTRFLPVPVPVREESEKLPAETRPAYDTSSAVTDASPPDSPCDTSPSSVGAAEPAGDPAKPPEDAPCPLCRQPPESSHDLRSHLEKHHPELSPSEIQQACEARDPECAEQEDRRGCEEPTPAPPQPAAYRKTTNFALDKFMDPSRPHKCVVCKESFTQKNILLVHYNSVSHLHKVRKASLDPSLSTRHEPGAGPQGLAGQTGQDKPYKCTVCHVSYNQSSTLEIHMRSVLHQTRSRGAKLELTRGPPEKPQRDLSCKNETPANEKGEAAGEPQGGEAPKKRPQLRGPCLGVSILPATVAPPTMQLSLDMPRPPPLIQPPSLFAPSLLPSFIPEALLKLQRQQQQLLLPFYLQELKVSGDGGAAPLLSFGGTQQPPPTKDEGDQPSVTPSPANDKEEGSMAEQNAATGEAEVSPDPESSAEPTPKGAGDITGSAARALLENFGFELVSQYNEGRQPATAHPPLQPRPPAPPRNASPTPTAAEKLQCGTCGKLFSNRLILKTHEEHIHQRLLPFEALSRYAANYRRSYDNHYPAGMTAETPGSSVTPLDFSVTSQSPRGGEEQEASGKCGFSSEQLCFLHSLLDLSGCQLEERILWAADKAGLPPAAVRQWYTQWEKVAPEWPDDEEEEASLADRWGNRRFSRTKFSDFQTQALSSFFESSAYPRDNEVENLSVLLGLSSRVVVVWFQNARQKARKHAAEAGTSPPSPPPNATLLGERPTANHKVSPCQKCGVFLPCIFQLIQHLKGCYSDLREEVAEEEESEDGLDQTTTPEQPSTTPQEGWEEEQEEAPVEEENMALDAEASVGSPTTNEQTRDSGTPDPPDHQQNSQLPTALLDLSLLFPAMSGDMGSQRKRKHEEESLSPTGSEGGDEPPRDKRLRTTILPEQLDILHRWYLQDSNPTRSTLDRISREVGLKKRVVQVWFQNTRARERKGQYRGVASSTGSGPWQQDDMPHEATKREVSTSYYYNISPGLVAAPLTIKTGPSAGPTTVPLMSKPPATSGPVTTPITTKPLVNPTPAISGLLNTTQVLPSLVNPPQLIPGLVNPTQALSGLVTAPQALSGLVNPTQAFSNLVNPAQVLSSLVNSPQASTGLLLAAFTAKPPAQPILLSTAPEAKAQPIPGPLASSQTSVGAGPSPASDKTQAPQNSQISIPSNIPTSEPLIQSQATETQTLENQRASSDKVPEDRGACKTLESQVHSPQGGDMSDSSSSDPGPSSPGKCGINSDAQLGSSGPRRYRTQMSSLQLRILKACYAEYRTPSMQECSILGGEIGLQKRVIQVWFQNARAKEKKARLQGLGGAEWPQPIECTHCNVKYGPTTPCRAHIFNRQHIARLRGSVQQQLKEESRYREPHPTGGTCSGSDSKPTSQILSFQGPTSVTPQIQRLTPLLLPGQGIPTPIGGLATFNTGPPPSLLGMASSVPPALLPRVAPPALPTDPSVDSSQPTLTPETPPGLKAASLLGGPFMPFSLAPAATPLFSPQIQGPYFQQLYGLKKRLFPINPVIPHTLLGLLPGPLKPAPETMLPLKPASPQTKATVGGQQAAPSEEELEGMEREDDPDDEDIPMVDVAMRYQCQRCKTSYEEAEEAEAHQRGGCYPGPPPHPPLLRLRVCTYHCLSCQVLLQGPAARGQHLRSQQHRARNACSDGASSAIPQLRPKNRALHSDWRNIQGAAARFSAPKPRDPKNEHRAILQKHARQRQHKYPRKLPQPQRVAAGS
ncbi:zinc finger homeobox protein 2 isoform X2 [Ascaphus truei]|uniref:zinc finger homeobox protein 2 isoform X2 n=1 Tax=Ascaphus truei TaxID=8439 RepID=UPI003F594C4C